MYLHYTPEIFGYNDVIYIAKILHFTILFQTRKMVFFLI